SRCCRCRVVRGRSVSARSLRDRTLPYPTDVPDTVRLLALVGGDEFKPGNEEQDRLLVAAAKPGPAFVVPTAAARQCPQDAVDNATRWFSRLDLELRELPVLKRADANSKEIAERARTGGFFYL